MKRSGPLDIAVVAACPFPQPRGTPVRILRLSEALRGRGHAIHVVTYPIGEGEPPPEIAVHRTPKVPTYRKTGPGPSLQKLLVMDPLLVRTLGRAIREVRPDVIYAHHYEGLLTALAACRKHGPPIVYDAHTLLSSELPAYGFALPGRWLSRVGAALDRRWPTKADHVVAVTDAIRNRLLAYGMAPDRVTVASQGIEEALFLPMPDPDPAGGDATNAARGGILVYAGNLAPYQGIDFLLRTLARVLARRPGVRLRILTDSGFGPYEALAASLGVGAAVEVRSVALQELPAALADCDVAINPRIDCDGIPIKLLNYLAAARPVVSFRGSAPILVEGETGALVEDGHVEAMADAVLGLLEDPLRARRIGLAGRRYAEEHHRWDRIAGVVEGVLQAVVAAR